jgi:RNA polymerase sigma-54 factor
MQTLSQHLGLLQKMTPQQIQYLKMLQLPVLALEQRIKEELEINPLLEEVEEMTQEQEEERAEEAAEVAEGVEVEQQKETAEDDGYSFEDFMNDDLSGYKTKVYSSEDEERDELPLADEVSLYQKILDQVRFLDFTPDELFLAEEIIGNIDEDGYLRRELSLIVQDLNLAHGLAITEEAAEKVLHAIQRLDPPGIGARSLRECLMVQLEVRENHDETNSLAFKILSEHWEDFSMKHYDSLIKNLHIDQQQLKAAIELIQKLNPKPGEGDFTPQQNYIVPDFIIERDNGDFIVMLNDRNIPLLRVNKRYKELMSKRKSNGRSNEVKDFIRKQFESAKWFIASIHQRRETMLKVMRAIVEMQKEFFETGENLKPMIYKDIADIIGMDISTISRTVNGKYVQTEFGVFELRYFFSDAIKTASGEEISNKEVKKKIREMIEGEDPSTPLSDDRLAEMLREQGINIARRTVAKYREAMNIPVARLRKKI